MKLILLSTLFIIFSISNSFNITQPIPKLIKKERHLLSLNSHTTCPNTKIETNCYHEFPNLKTTGCATGSCSKHGLDGYHSLGLVYDPCDSMFQTNAHLCIKDECTSQMLTPPSRSDCADHSKRIYQYDRHLYSETMSTYKYYCVQITGGCPKSNDEQQRRLLVDNNSTYQVTK
eukprot:169351_1